MDDLTVAMSGADSASVSRAMKDISKLDPTKRYFPNLCDPDKRKIREFEELFIRTGIDDETKNTRIRDASGEWGFKATADAYSFRDRIPAELSGLYKSTGAVDKLPFVYRENPANGDVHYAFLSRVETKGDKIGIPENEIIMNSEFVSGMKYKDVKQTLNKGFSEEDKDKYTSDDDMRKLWMIVHGYDTSGRFRLGCAFKSSSAGAWTFNFLWQEVRRVMNDSWDMSLGARYLRDAGGKIEREYGIKFLSPLEVSRAFFPTESSSISDDLADKHRRIRTYVYMVLGDGSYWPTLSIWGNTRAPVTRFVVMAPLAILGGLILYNAAQVGVAKGLGVALRSIGIIGVNAWQFIAGLFAALIKAVSTLSLEPLTGDWGVSEYLESSMKDFWEGLEGTGLNSTGIPEFNSTEIPVSGGAEPDRVASYFAQTVLNAHTRFIEQFGDEWYAADKRSYEEIQKLMHENVQPIAKREPDRDWVLMDVNATAPSIPIDASETGLRQLNKVAGGALRMRERNRFLASDGAAAAGSLAAGGLQAGSLQAGSLQAGWVPLELLRARE